MATSYFRPILLLVAILTLFQSIAWFILSLLGVLSYRCHLDVPESTDKGSQFELLLYYLYFQGPECTAQVNFFPSEIHIRDYVYATPSYINSWMAAYLALNISYFIISIRLFVGLCKLSNNQPFSVSSIRLWCLNTLAFIIMDLWLTIVWGIEFNYISEFIDTYSDVLKGTFDWATSVPGALMAITARGFILYVINVVLFIYMVRYAVDWRRLTQNGCCQTGIDGSQQQLHQNQPGSNLNLYPGIPRPSTWNSAQAVVPYNSGRMNQIHSNRMHDELVTSFNNDWNEPPQPPPKPWREESARPPMEEIFLSRPSRPTVRSNMAYPDPRKFEQGGTRADRPARLHDNNNY